ncbi:glycosyltransferase, partial [Klebsiella pneumoniae]|nr:glycosyltransferase [Klebsiella pneumoniae]
VRAMARPEAPDVPLLVAGRPGWGQLDLQRIAEESGMAQQLRLLGPVSDAELAVLLHRASALAAPRLDEGVGLPVVEAMACGVPVVHSDAPALVEVAGGAGSVVPRTDPAALAVALRTAVEDRER